MVAPPERLLEPCSEPQDSGDVITLLQKGKSDEAAVEYVRYVLDVRDAFQLCNGRFQALREWREAMNETGR